MSDDEIDFDEDDPIAVWEAAFLPDWEWEAYEVEERNAELGLPDEDTATGLDLDMDEQDTEGLKDEDDLPTVETTIYFGRVRSPHTYGDWEYGSFSAHELKQVGAFRTDEDTGEWP